MRTLSLLYLLIISHYTYSDCEFKIINYSSTNIKVQVGFLGRDSNSSEVDIPNTATRVVKVKSHHDCLSHTGAGTGIAYVHLIGGKSSGNWVYSPEGSMIRAVGKTASTTSGVYGIAPNGQGLFLKNTYKPDKEMFSVVIKDAERNLSKIGSMN